MTRWSYAWKTTYCYPHQWTVSTVPTQCRGQRTANLEMATIGDASTGNALRIKEPPQRFEKAAFSKTPGCLSRDVLPCALLMVNPWFWDAHSRPHKGQHPHIGQFVHHLPSSLQPISPSSSNWTFEYEGNFFLNFVEHISLFYRV